MADRELPKAVIFDLDGTLVDSAPDIAASINLVLVRDGLAAFDLADVRGFIGHGIKKLVERAYAARQRPLEGPALDSKVATFQDVYIARVAELTRPYPGAIELVKALRGQGVKTGICTNKVEPLTLSLLRGLDIAPLFDAVVGGSDRIVAKPAADMMVETLRRLDAKPDEAIMIGDSESDVECARAAGVPVIGVTFGYTKVPMRDLKPDVVIDHLDEALAAIRGLRALLS